MFGIHYIRRPDLSDGELATLIAHDVAHAVAEHQREKLSQLFYLNTGSVPISVATAMARIDSDQSLQTKLATRLKIQESEAALLGMILAHDAGWPMANMVSFYNKLAATDAPTVLSSELSIEGVATEYGADTGRNLKPAVKPAISR